MLGFCLAGHSLLEAVLFHRLGTVDIILQTGWPEPDSIHPGRHESQLLSWQLGSWQKMALQETSWQHHYGTKGAQARADLVRKDWDIGWHREMSKQ